MSTSNNGSSSGISFIGLLTIAFIVLKLTGVISWSWWWVLAPMWFGIAAVIAIFIIVLIGIVLRCAIKRGNI